MAKRTIQRRSGFVGGRDQSKLRWRANQIGKWRERAGLTQQEVADRLASMGIKRDRVSITRIEAGRQMPGIEVLEAIATIVKAPSVTAMTDYTPEQWDQIQRFLSMDEQERERVLRIAAAVNQ